MDYRYTRDVLDIHLEHHWLYPELMQAVHLAPVMPVVDCGTVQEPSMTILDLRGVVPIARHCRGGEDTGEVIVVDPALRAVPVTGCDVYRALRAVPVIGCDADSALRAVPVTGCDADPALRTVPVTGRGHEQTLDEMSLVLRAAPVTGCGRDWTLDET